ncbi:MAG: DUF4296 domain-containing protein [Bacteroidota bacterium]
MKKISALFLLLSICLSCEQSSIVKPDNLIDEDVMVDIIYDFSLLEAIKAENRTSLQENKINPNDYIYKKYKIDSLQFAKSDQYYASDVKNYKKLYEKVTKRLEEKTKKYEKETILRPSTQKTVLGK